MNADPVNAKKSQKPIKEFLSYEFEKVFRSSKNVYWRQQQLCPTGILAMTFLKPVREANMYVLFVYIPKKICNHVQVQAFGSTNAYLINVN